MLYNILLVIIIINGQSGILLSGFYLATKVDMNKGMKANLQFQLFWPSYDFIHLIKILFNPKVLYKWFWEAPIQEIYRF